MSWLKKLYSKVWVTVENAPYLNTRDRFGVSGNNRLRVLNLSFVLYSLVLTMTNQYNLLAALLYSCCFTRCYCQQSLYRGEGFATYYYDVEQPKSCSTNLATMNSSPTKCGLSPDAVNSNNIVAINLTQLSSDMSLLCGEQVVISVNDKVQSHQKSPDRMRDYFETSAGAKF